jgi:sugar lactone lactonase YvrE
MTLEVFQLPGPGAEDVVVAGSGRDEGSVFTGTADGALWRIGHDGSKIDRVAHTGGRPLGIEIAADGRLLVCDAHQGLLRVDTATGAIEPVTDKVDGIRMRFCNNAAIAAGGTSGSPTHQHSSASTAGRTISSGTPAPAACSASARTARWRS